MICDDITDFATTPPPMRAVMGLDLGTHTIGAGAAV